MEFKFVDEYDTLCAYGPRIVDEYVIDENYDLVRDGHIVVRTIDNDPYSFQLSVNMIPWAHIMSIEDAPYHQIYKYIPTRNRIIVDIMKENWDVKISIEPIYEKIVQAVNNLKYSECQNDNISYTLDWMVFKKILVYDVQGEYIINGAFFTDNNATVSMKILKKKLMLSTKDLNRLMNYLGYDLNIEGTMFTRADSYDKLYIE
jgi:hypothetical protein